MTMGEADATDSVALSSGTAEEDSLSSGWEAVAEVDVIEPEPWMVHVQLPGNRYFQTTFDSVPELFDLQDCLIKHFSDEAVALPGGSGMHMYVDDMQLSNTNTVDVLRSASRKRQDGQPRRVVLRASLADEPHEGGSDCSGGSRRGRLQVPSLKFCIMLMFVLTVWMRLGASDDFSTALQELLRRQAVQMTDNMVTCAPHLQAIAEERGNARALEEKNAAQNVTVMRLEQAIAEQRGKARDLEGKIMRLEQELQVLRAENAHLASIVNRSREDVAAEKQKVSRLQDDVAAEERKTRQCHDEVAKERARGWDELEARFQEGFRKGTSRGRSGCEQEALALKERNRQLEEAAVAEKNRAGLAMAALNPNMWLQIWQNIEGHRSPEMSGKVLKAKGQAEDLLHTLSDLRREYYNAQWKVSRRLREAFRRVMSFIAEMKDHQAAQTFRMTKGSIVFLEGI